MRYSTIEVLAVIQSFSKQARIRFSVMPLQIEQVSRFLVVCHGNFSSVSGLISNVLEKSSNIPLLIDGDA